MVSKTLNVVLDDWLRVPTDGLIPMIERKLHERLVFTNPDYEMRHNRGEWIGSIPAQISCLRQKGRYYLLPRGFLDQFTDLCKKFQQTYRLSDRRRSLDPIPIEFHGQLKAYQQDAAESVLTHDFATLVGGHKSGKTVISLYTIAQRRQPTLILIPKLELLENWLIKIENFLQIPRSAVGVVANGSQSVGKQITIAHTGEITRLWRKVNEKVGYLIMDDCQRCPSKVLTHLVTNFDTRYMLGLSYAGQRKDRLSKLVYYYVGDVVYTINDKDAREGRGIIPAHVVARATDFDYPYHSRSDYPGMLDALMEDAQRTRLIVDDIEMEVGKAAEPLLVLTGGDDQNKFLASELARRGINSTTFTGMAASPQDDEEGELQDELVRAPAEPSHQQPGGAVLVSDRTLTQCLKQIHSRVLFLAVPTYFHKTLAQALRSLSQNGNSAEGRRIVIYDYVDQKVGLLENYFRMRSYNYGVHPDILLSSSPH
ncbi:MAG: hypothetical protein MUF52_00555 [Syntrophobacteraceae bacterium]|jgi:hypothetical protein|nr:hypothetical protein [Syntrophobacteraceae bacterium]